MNGQAWGDVILLVVCIVLSAMASATETAMTSVGRLRVRHLAEEGSRTAATLQRLQQDPNRFLSTVLVVNTVALILASFATTLLSLQYMPSSVGFLGDLLLALGEGADRSRDPEPPDAVRPAQGRLPLAMP